MAQFRPCFAIYGFQSCRYALSSEKHSAIPSPAFWKFEIVYPSLKKAGVGNEDMLTVNVDG